MKAGPMSLTSGRPQMRTLFLESVVAVVLVALATPVAAHQATAEIRGRVVDQNGGVLPGVVIVLTNEDTGVFRETSSGADGSYSASQHAFLAVATLAALRSDQFELESSIAFSSTRDDPTGQLLLASEIYLTSADFTNSRRLTSNTAGDIFPSLSPDGTKVVFESNRNRTKGEPLNTSDLFVMNTDGTEQTPLVRGSSATWAPDSKTIAFHASASGIGQPINNLPGAPASDSDIFVVNVADVLTGAAEPKNLTHDGSLWIDEDADWSPVLPVNEQLAQKIVFVRKRPADTDNTRPATTAEIFVMNADGTGLTSLTSNAIEERAPAWSPDGKRLLFMCRIGPPGSPTSTTPTFEICVMNADGPYGAEDWVRLTDNAVGDLTPSWSPDGRRIVFHRQVAVGQGGVQLWSINSTLNPDGTLPVPVQLTTPPGVNGYANWGEVRRRQAR
jgi:TolB protein